jgi:hypothetical protein
MWSESIKTLSPYEALKEANKVENKNAIYNDDVERIVNDPERQKAIRRRYSEKRKRNNLKIVNWAVAFGFVSLFFSLMAVTGCMIVWVAFPLCTFFGMLSAFTAGRWFENGKCLGWE